MKSPARACAAFVLPLLMLGAAAQAAPGYRAVTVAAGLEHPWGMAFLPDGRMLVSERPGRLRIVSRKGAISPPLAGLPPIAAIGQGGLLDVALHPDFAANRLVYFSFAEPGPGGAGTAAARGQLAGNALQDVQVIFRQRPKLAGGLHFGARLAFARDGTLFLSMGDRGRMERAQERNNHLGTIVRIRDDGSIPADNPFVDTPGVLPEIYSWGHRNVQGMARNPWTGEMWAHEHGPKGGDEINILKPGANYGWPLVTFGIDYDGSIISEKTEAPGIEPPLLHWTPSIAPSGMAFYDGRKFPAWRGDLLVGTLKFRHLRRIDLEGGRVVGQEELLGALGERIRDVRQGPEGNLWVLTDSPRGRVIRIEPR
ncbi:MAG: PQQ-dependent sugar dehydrogenase [Alphaproteobacteria bacterium]|nr:MAG: PQQ-dependent sugar dehydrogenase [Alphaproteobacteria bacterium]